MKNLCKPILVEGDDDDNGDLDVPVYGTHDLPCY
jgi:hypothetical protein